MATIKQYVKKDGSKAWQFQSYLGINPKTGKPVKTTRRNFKTKKEAQLELNRLLVDFEQNGLKKQRKVKFKEVYDMWLSSYKQTVRESTFLNTERHTRLHILPSLGHLYIDKIDVKTAQKLVNKLVDELQIYKSVIKYASKVMEYAINLEFIEKNPFDRTINPKEKRTREEKAIKFYTLDEINQSLTYLNENVNQNKYNTLIKRYFSEWAYTAFRLLAFTGLRGGEALALNFSDIDFNTQTLTVNKTISRVKDGITIAPPKTKKSNRVISLDDKTIRILKKWQFRQKEFFFATGSKGNDIIFSNIYGKHSTTRMLSYYSEEISKNTGLPFIAVHGWRHSHASMLYTAGATMKEAQERLGHTSIEITNSIYTHLSDKQKSETANKIAKIANF